MFVQETWVSIDRPNRQKSFRICTQDDFGKSESAIKIFNEFKSQYLLCPDFQDDTFYLQGNKPNLKYSRIDFTIGKCFN